MVLKSKNSSVANFGHNVYSEPKLRFSPQSKQELLDLMADHALEPIRVVGSLHAWSEGIKTPGLLIAIDQLTDIKVDRETQVVVVGGGCQVKDLLKELARFDLTLPSVGLIDEQTVAGATATGTHGSGKNSLSHYVQAVTVAHYDAETGNPVITRIDRGPELRAARCSMGLMGIVVEIEFQCRPRYNICEFVRRHKSLDAVLAAEMETPLQQFYMMPWSWAWYGQHRVETTDGRSKSAGLYRAYWHLSIDWGLHLVLYSMVKLLKFRWLIKSFFRLLLPLTLKQNWRVVDDSHKMLVMEHELFRHIEIEIFVTRTQLEPTLRFLRQVITVYGSKTAPPDLPREDLALLKPKQNSWCHHYPICIRRVLPDDTLISMSCPRTAEDREDSYAISMISYDWPTQRDGFFDFANFVAHETCRRFNARVHWGKYNPLTSSENDALYPELPQFRETAKRFDAHRTFANEWLRDAMNLSDDTIER